MHTAHRGIRKGQANGPALQTYNETAFFRVDNNGGDAQQSPSSGAQNDPQPTPSKTMLEVAEAMRSRPLPPQPVVLQQYGGYPLVVLPEEPAYLTPIAASARPALSAYPVSVHDEPAYLTPVSAASRPSLQAFSQQSQGYAPHHLSNESPYLTPVRALPIEPPYLSPIGSYSIGYPDMPGSYFPSAPVARPPLPPATYLAQHVDAYSQPDAPQLPPRPRAVTLSAYVQEDPQGQRPPVMVRWPDMDVLMPAYRPAVQQLHRRQCGVTRRWELLDMTR